MSEQDKDKLIRKALWSASYIQLSPHEWTWTQKEQEDMARALLILNEKSEFEKRLKTLERRFEAHQAQDRADNMLAKIHRLEDLHNIE